jgi:phosphotransacetylase
MLSFTTFGQPKSERSETIREAVGILDGMRVDFEYDGEMAADVALSRELMAAQYPFCRLTGPSNVLVMPAFHSASISTKLLGHARRRDRGRPADRRPRQAGSDRPDRLHGRHHRQYGGARGV